MILYGKKINELIYYLLVDEDDPYVTFKSKNYIQNIMFLVVVARPNFNDEGNETFTRKISMFSLINKILARRSSVNRVVWTVEIKLIIFITK